MIKGIRLFLTTLYIGITSFIGIFYCLFRPFAAENTKFLGRLLAFGTLPLMGTRLEVEGLENFDKIKGPAIVLSNHQDNHDLFLIGQFVPYKTVSIGKEIIRLFPLFGQIYWLSGHILIDRKRKKSALNTMNQAGEQMKKKGIKVWIMPEGTRSRGKGLLPFKKGAFYLAHQTKLPLYIVTFSNYAKHWDPNIWKKHTIYAKVHEPLIFAEDNYPEVEDLLKQCRTIVEEGINEMDIKAGYHG